MEQKLTIRKATELDLPAIVEIYNQAIKRKFCTAHTHLLSVMDRMEWYQKHDDQHPLFVAIKGHEIAGWLSFTAYREGRGALNGVREVSYYVHGDHQGK